MSKIIEIDFFNSYWLKSIKMANADNIAGFPKGHPGVAYPGGLALAYSTRNYYIEEARIRGGFNNTATDNGVRAYLDEQYPLQQKRINTLIYSGIFNSRTGINKTNVFSTGDSITKSLDPLHGSIQKTYSEDTNLIVFQENKIHRALIDKDTIYTTESGTQTQAAAAVVGQFVPYKGEYGISKNPESFAIYNYRKYFSDKNRNSIMRLSNDGLTEISMYGMMDWFRDNLAEISDEFEVRSSSTTIISGGQSGDITVVVTVPAGGVPPSVGMHISGVTGGYVTNVTYNQGGNNYTVSYSKLLTGSGSPACVFEYKTRGRVIGGWDIHNKNYVVSLQKSTNQVTLSNDSYNTLTFDEQINGWVSFLTFKPNFLFSVVNKTYTTQNSDLYQQYDTTVLNNRGLFYGTRSKSNVTFVFNGQPSVVKNFQTISYEGSNGWEVSRYSSGFTGFDYLSGQYNQSQDITNNQPSGSLVGNISIPSYLEGAYDSSGNTGTSASPVNQPLLRAGFDRKENKYVANLKNNSVVNAGEVLFGNQMSGIKGYFATVTIQDDQYTDLGGPKELWSAGTKYVVSSY